MENRETVVLAADGFEPAEREPFVRLAAALKRPRHLILLETAREHVRDEDLAALNELRRALDARRARGRGLPDGAPARRWHRRRGEADSVPPAAA